MCPYTFINHNGRNLTIAVSKLWELEKDYALETINPADALKSVVWFTFVPSAFEAIEEVKKSLSVDLSYPVILAPNRKLLDGAHRCCKAYILNLPLLGFVITSWNVLEDLDIGGH